jgi:flagellar biogenesis protein FliO
MQRTIVVASRTLIVPCLLALAASQSNADVGYESSADSVTQAAPQPNYFIEESAAQPLSPQLVEQPADDRDAPGFQYPAQAAALIEDEARPPAELESASTASQKSLPLPPPSDNPSAEQRARLTKPLASGAASLGIVLGLFLLVVLVMRRGMPKGATSLPHDVVEVLGRAPLVGRQQVHLVRCANKVLLVCVSPTSAQTLTEITDPHEVEQLLITCRGSGAGGAAFGKILEQFGAPTESASHDRRYATHHQESELDFSHLEALQQASRKARA